MKTSQRFEALHGKKASRQTLKAIVNQAKKENNTEVVYRISKILNDHPKENSFNITVKKYATALNAPRHKGLYKQALTECGRLKKGWKFTKGRVIKAKAKVPKTTRKYLAGTTTQEGLTKSGKLRKGYKYAKGGKIVKAGSKKKVL